MKDIIQRFIHSLAEDNSRNHSSSPRYQPKDRRLLSPDHTDSQLSFTAYHSLAAWQQRAQALKRQLLVASGLYPYPERCELIPNVFDEQCQKGYRTAKFTIQSYPGFLVTGNVFFPDTTGEKHPVILNPHGHWEQGRLQHSQDCSVLARCVNFAMMGFVAISFDMIGYQDSKQISHGFGQGLACQGWGISGFGLQLWNAIRVLDFACGLPQVDQDRVGITGASGGATQAFALAAVDDRVKAVAPVNMVSLTMQGGCACENAPLLRLGTNNLELVSLVAPRPLLLAGSTGDWTRDLLSVDDPAVRSIYALYGAEHRLERFFQDAPHNYNAAARHAAYQFFARHLLHQDMAWQEQPVTLDAQSLRIYRDDEGPSAGIQGNGQMVQLLIEERQKAVDRMLATGQPGRSYIKEGLRFVLGLHEEPVSQRVSDVLAVEGYHVERGFLSTARGEQVPYCLVKRAGDKPQQAMLLLHEQGKYEALARNHRPPKGTILMAVDLFLTGDYHQPGARAGRNAAGVRHFSSFNYSDDALMISDIYIACRFLRASFQSLTIHGEGRTAQMLAMLAAFVPEAAPYADTGDKQLFLPCVAALGGAAAGAIIGSQPS